MRRMMPVVLLGIALVGCAEPKAPSKPLDASLGTVTMEVKGMT